jgi:hypothetical protein
MFDLDKYRSSAAYSLIKLDAPVNSVILESIIGDSVVLKDGVVMKISPNPLDYFKLEGFLMFRIENLKRPVL